MSSRVQWEKWKKNVYTKFTCTFVFVSAFHKCNMCKYAIFGVTDLQGDVYQFNPVNKGSVDKNQVSNDTGGNSKCTPSTTFPPTRLTFNCTTWSLIYSIKVTFLENVKRNSKKGWGDESLALLERIIFSSYRHWAWGVNYECSWGQQIYRADNGGGEIQLIMLRRETNE